MPEVRKVFGGGGQGMDVLQSSILYLDQRCMDYREGEREAVCLQSVGRPWAASPLKHEISEIGWSYSSEDQRRAVSPVPGHHPEMDTG